MGYYNVAETFFSLNRNHSTAVTAGSFFDYQSFLGGYTSGNSNYGISHADYRFSSGFDTGTGNLPVPDSPKLS